MRCPSLSELPPPPQNRAGWPWTEESTPAPSLRPDGHPWPRITIVTPSYNQGEYIEETIRSILLQGYPDLEYFVMDGGSDDRTIEIIRKYENWITYWESAQDNGQAHAINKGLDRATGEWFQNINSDDYLLPSALASVGSSPKGSNVVAGIVENFLEDEITQIANTRLNCKNLLTFPLGHASWHQPGVFLKTSHIRTIGGFNEQLQFNFDQEATIAYLELFPKVHYIDRVLTRFRLHPRSKTTQNKSYAHEGLIIRQNLSETLSRRYNRSFAKMEASRILVRNEAIDEWGHHRQLTSVSKQAIDLLKKHPEILLDRVVLASVKKNPRHWLISVCKHAFLKTNEGPEN